MATVKGPRTTPATRRAALTRLLLTAIFGPAIALVGVGVAGANILLVFAAVPTLYLLWAFALDAVTVLRGTFGPVEYAERPRYRWFFGTGVAMFLAWSVLHLTPLRQIIGVK